MKVTAEPTMHTSEIKWSMLVILVLVGVTTGITTT